MQKYELKGVVGEGAYGKVFMARNKETGDVGKWPQPAFLFSVRQLTDLTTFAVSVSACSCDQEIQRVGR